MDVGTLNITAGNPPTPDYEVQADVDAVVAVADVVGFQELFNGSHNDIIANLADWDDYGLHSGRYQAIAWRTARWTFVNGGSEQIFAGSTTTASDGTVISKPARYLTWVVLERTTAYNGPQKIRFVTSHFTSGANWDNPTPTEEEQASRAGWQACWDAMNARIDQWMASGYTPIVITGDYNKKVPDMPKFAADQEWDTTGGIDQISHIPNAKMDPVSDITPNGPIANGDGTYSYYTDHGPDVWRIKFL